MSNFVTKSKDLCYSNNEKFRHFERVFHLLDSLSKAKNYYSFDLFNLEEILSLLEMEDFVGQSRNKKTYITYLHDVLAAYTPDFRLGDNPFEEMRGGGRASVYRTFVASLFSLEWPRPLLNFSPTVTTIDTPCSYSVVTLNYDMVIESALEALLDATKAECLALAKTSEERRDSPQSLPLAKLHGSLSPLTIVPPTWNKVSVDRTVKDAWELAFTLLSEATQIRFVGYSLPATDTYVRYLLGSSVLRSKHLKGIDVICLDDSTSGVRKRFSEMITFPNFRFASYDFRSYLSEIDLAVSREVYRTGRPDTMSFDKLETVHDEFMRLHSQVARM